MTCPVHLLGQDKGWKNVHLSALSRHQMSMDFSHSSSKFKAIFYTNPLSGLHSI